MTSELAKALNLEDEELDTYLEGAGITREKFILAFSTNEKQFLETFSKIEEKFQDKEFLELTDKKFKGNPGRYTIQNIIQVLGEILKQTHPQEIASSTGITATQIKKIRLIFKNGNEYEKLLMLKCKWFLSNIKRNIRLRKLGEKKKKVALKKLPIKVKQNGQQSREQSREQSGQTLKKFMRPSPLKDKPIIKNPQISNSKPMNSAIWGDEE